VVMAYYILRGYKVLAHRWRVNKFGEIDLVVCRCKTLVFVEVKARRLVIAEEIMQISQLRRMKKVISLFYLKFPKYKTYNTRIDFAVVRYFVLPQILQNAHFFDS
jgi:putative endonuclease